MGLVLGVGSGGDLVVVDDLDLEGSHAALGPDSEDDLDLGESLEDIDGLEQEVVGEAVVVAAEVDNGHSADADLEPEVEGSSEPLGEPALGHTAETGADSDQDAGGDHTAGDEGQDGALAEKGEKEDLGGDQDAHLASHRP